MENFIFCAVVESLESHHFFKPKLILSTPCISESWIEVTINLNFYFQTSLWCLKTFWGTTKKYENKNVSYFPLFVLDWNGKD